MDAARAVNRFLSDLSRGNHHPLVLTSSFHLRHFFNGSFAVVSCKDAQILQEPPIRVLTMQPMLKKPGGKAGYER
jgi:hypothetical protein